MLSINLNKIIILILGILIISIFIPLISSNSDSRNNIYVDNDANSSWYDATHVKTIQEGINNASSGDSIFVYNGSYYENLIIDKSINLNGEAPNNTIIESVSENHTINITSNNVNISGFTIKNGSKFFSGIQILANNILLFNNNIYNNYNGINISGCYSNITHNNISSNKWYGIILHDSFNNISMNTFIDDGIYVQKYKNNISENTVNSKPLVYFENISNTNISENAGQIILVGCNNISIQNQNISFTDLGIQLLDTYNCNISNLNISNSLYGIDVGYSNHRSMIHDINISNNVINSCNISGIRISGDHNILNQNQISHCNTYGIESTGSYCNLHYNNISNCKNGLNINYGYLNNITSNNISFSNYNGMLIEYSDYVFIYNNNLDLNGRGILISNCDNTIFYQNNVSNSIGFGLISSGIGR